jgi:thioredoxin reductase (NADPH)
LEVPGEKEFTGKGVSYCATCDGFFFRGKDVIVVGGGDSAAEESVFLTKFARQVQLVHRRDELRASKILQDRVFANEKIETVWNTIVTEVVGENGKTTGVKTKNTLTGAEGFLKTDGVFIFVGHLPNNQLLQGKFDLDADGHLVCDKFMRTNIPGVFAAGEIMDKTYKQVATSVGQGCAAAMQATKFLEELHDGAPLRLDVDPREFYAPSARKAEVVPA